MISVDEHESPTVTPARRRSSVDRATVLSDSVDGLGAPPVEAVVPETERLALLAAMRRNYMFARLTDLDIAVLLPHMLVQRFCAGSRIVTLGDVGNHFFLLRRGSAAVTNAANRSLAVLNEGSSFGELALCFGVTRQATVTAVTDCDCLVLDQLTFKRVMKMSVDSHRALLLSVLANVALFEDLSEWQRLTCLQYARTDVKFSAGTRIFAQGDATGAVYIITGGTAEVRKREGGSADQEMVLATLGVYDVFGELALVTNETRFASVYATAALSCIELDAEQLKQLLGVKPDLVEAWQRRYDIATAH